MRRWLLTPVSQLPRRNQERPAGRGGNGNHTPDARPPCSSALASPADTASRSSKRRRTAAALRLADAAGRLIQSRREQLAVGILQALAQRIALAESSSTWCRCSRSHLASTSLKRYCCKGCGRTFNALTGTALARLRKKELWAAFAEGLSDGDTVKGAASVAGWPAAPRSAGGIGSWPRSRAVPSSSRALSRPTKPMCWTAARVPESSIASRANEVASPRNAGFPGSRWRSWWQPHSPIP